jgi:hypothetical protein
MFERKMKWQEAGEHCIKRSFITFMLTRYNLGVHIKQNEMEVSCSTQGIHERE